MIAPRSLMLWVFLAVGMPVSLAMASSVLALPAAGVFAAFALVAAVDAARALKSVRQLSATAPALLRWTHNRAAAIPLTVSSGDLPVRGLEAGLILPARLGCAEPTAVLGAVPASSDITTLFECLPAERGADRVARAAVGVISPIGLWRARAFLPLNTEVRVYPDLRPSRQAVSMAVQHGTPGLHLQRPTGRGREFEKNRDYVQGDPPNEIHWKATARRGRPVTRVFQIERTQELYIALDCSRLSARPLENGNVLDCFVSGALSMMLASKQQGDLFGLLTFSNELQHAIRAGGRTSTYQACRNALLEAAPRAVAPDFREACASIQNRIRHRAMVVIFTDLGDPALSEDFTEAIRPVAGRHFVVVASVAQPGTARVFEQPASDAGQIYERLAGHLAWRRGEELRAQLRRLGVRAIAAPPNRLAIELVRSYWNAKRQQLV